MKTCILWFLFCLSAQYLSVHASHFRGGIIMWEPTGNRNEIKVIFRISWRRDYGTTFCDSDTIKQSRLVAGEGDITCFSGCAGQLGSLSFYCTDFSTEENWSSGSNSFVYEFTNSAYQIYQFGFSGNAWISGIQNANAGNWMLRSTANLTRRVDNGRINSSPKSVMQPIVRLQYGCNHKIGIPVTDLDGDNVRCRFARDNLDECASICGSFNRAEMDERECTIKYSATEGTGWYVVAVQIEDFSSVESTVALSSVPLQFLVIVFNSEASCESKPTFVYPTRVHGSCIGLQFNSTYFEPIIARSGGNNTRILEISTASPLGMTTSPLAPYGQTGREWFVNSSWEQIPKQHGSNIFCYTAQDSNGQTSEKTCITFVIGVTPPQYIDGSQNPIGDILPAHNTWQVQFDKWFVRPSRTTYMYFKEKDTGATVYKLDVSTSPDAHYPSGLNDRVLTINTNFIFTEKIYYFIVLDPGAACGITDCGVESEAIKNITFWTFRIRDITKPVLTFKSAPKISNGTITISWMFNEEVTTSCTLVMPNKTEQQNCSRFWTGENLKEGLYTLFIYGTDLENNQADAAQHDFTIDQTAPAVYIYRRPNTITNYGSFTFDFTCDEWCIAYCSLHEDGQEPSFSHCGSAGLGHMSYYSGDLLDNRTYIFSVKATDKVDNVGQLSSAKFFTDFSPPRMNNLEPIRIQCGEDFSPNMTGTPNVTDNIPTNVSLNYQDSVTSSCGVSRKWIAIDSAGNTVTKIQEISFTAIRQPQVEVLNLSIIACGDVEEFTNNMKEYLRKHVAHPCKIPILSVTFNDSIKDPNQCAVIFTRTWTVLFTCGETLNAKQQIKVLNLQLPITPTSGQLNVDVRSVLRWPSYFGAFQYRLFVWKYNEPKPNNSIAVTGWPWYEPRMTFDPDTKYAWQVEFCVANTTEPGPKWAFETIKVPDLMVETVRTPPVAFSGQSFVVSWSVRNVGSGTTDDFFWNDIIYISFTDNLNEGRLVKYVTQRNILFSNDGYTSQTDIFLRNDDIGPLNVFVKTNYHDANSTNNIRKSDRIIDVKLTPPPDLQVDSIVLLENIYSGQSISVKFTIQNHGYGATVVDRWYDNIFWSNDISLDRFDLSLNTIYRRGKLSPGESYTVSTSIVIPKHIFGNFCIIVETDSGNNVYEHTKEGNNQKILIINVVLFPPADLEITSVITGEEYSTGDYMKIQWEVINNGVNAPDVFYWSDSVVLSSLKDPDAQYFIDSAGFQGDLQPTSTYKRSVEFRIPTSVLSGEYNVTVHVDYKDYVFEYLSKNNNIMAKKIRIHRYLPDLYVSNLAVKVNTSSINNVIYVSWTVVNGGAGKTIDSEWTDTVSVMLLKEYFNTVHRLKDFDVMKLNSVNSNESYSNQFAFILPNYVYGNVSFILQCDIYQQSADVNRANNLKQSSEMFVPLRAPDLYVSDVKIYSDEVYSGGSVQVECSIGNLGIPVKSGEIWSQNIFLTLTKAEPQALVYMSSRHVGPVIPGELYQTLTTLTIPKSVEGKVYIHCSINLHETVYEGDDKERLSNNHKSIELHVYRPPSADLTVLSLKVALINTTSTNIVISIEWSVQNLGNSMAYGTKWKDAVGISSDKHSIFNADNTKYDKIEEFEVLYGLEHSASYFMSKLIAIPRLPMGIYYFYIITDYENNIIEFDGEENNIKISDPQYVPPMPMAKLSVVSFEINERSLTPGRTINISFRIKNIGNASTSLTSWDDQIYFLDSKDAARNQILQYGHLLSTSLHIGALHPCESYQTNVTATIPRNSFGHNYFFILSMDNNILSGSDFDTNMQSSLNFSQNGINDTVQSSLNFYQNQPIFIDNSTLPNLYGSSNASLGNQKGGQPLVLNYQISNNGKTSTSNLFFCSLYLSDDYVLDPFDVALKVQYTIDDINMNEILTRNVSVFLPFDLENKNYFIVISIDAGNNIYESDELDNDIFISLSIEQTFSTDLAVVDVVAPTSVNYGGNILINWTIKNNGTKDAQGYKCDSVFLSTDSQWDIEDEQIGSPTCGFVHLSANEELDNQMSSLLSTMTESSYTAIVKSRTNILDKNLENNVGIANNKTNIEITHLQIDSKVSVSINDMAKLFLVPNVPAEETLVIKSTSKIMDGFYEIKVKYSKAATEYDYDVVSENPYESNQTIIVPYTKSGSYYLLLTAKDAQHHAYLSDIDLYVKLAKFEILQSSPFRASFLGNTTIKIEGTLFPENVGVVLIKNASFSIEPVQFFRFSSTVLYGTFDLKPTKLGETYSIRLTNIVSRNFTELHNALTIVAGEIGQVSVRLTVPDALRLEESGIVYVDIENVGLTDIIAPLISVNSDKIGYLRLITDGKKTYFAKQYLLIANSINSPGGILPPGCSSRFIFELKQIDIPQVGLDTIRVNVIYPSNDRHTYLSLKDNIRFNYPNNAALDRVWDNFIQLTGTTWHSLNWKLSEIVNRMFLSGRRVQQVSDVISYLIEIANGHNENIILSQSTDIQSRRKLARSITLEFSRSFSSKISSRYDTGVMGSGWIIQYGNNRLNNIGINEANITIEGRLFIFSHVEKEVYENPVLGELAMSYLNGSKAYKYTDRAAGKDYFYSLKSGYLLAIGSTYDVSRLDFYYDSGRLQKMQHTDGSYIVLQYNPRGFIMSAELKSNFNNDQKSFYEYDPQMDLLTSVNINGKITQYEYNTDNSLKAIIHPNGQKEEFEYYPQGWLRSRTLTFNNTLVDRKVYIFNGGAEVVTKMYPSNKTVTVIYDENGDIALQQQEGLLTLKQISSDNGKSLYQGDALISMETYEKATNTILIKDANGDYLNISYTEHGRVKQLTDSDNNVYSASYNANGTINHVIYPDNSTEIYEYTSHGRTFTTRSGEKIKSDLDENDNIILKDFGRDRLHSYSYDSQQRLTKVQTERGTTSFEYNENGLPEYVKFDNNIFVNYTFNEQFQKSCMKLSLGGYDIKYEYNDKNLLTKVYNAYDGNILLQAEYNENMLIKKKTLGNGAYTQYSYYVDTSLLKGVYNHFPNGTISSKFEYTYDTRQRRISLETMEGNWKFRYDPSGQITYIRTPAGTTTQYQYDSRKNRKVIIKDGVRNEYNTNELNQYSSFGNHSLYRYDKNGNLMSKDGENKKELEFNNANQLVKFRHENDECFLSYDGANNLLEKICGMVRTQYVVDMYGRFGSDVLAEIVHKGESTETTLYFHGGDQLGLIALKTKDGYYYYQFDPLGSVESLLNKDGALMNSYRYAPFGNITHKAERIKNSFTFIGQWGVMSMGHIEELYYMRARFYDAELGRFLSMDPLGIDGKSKNFYVYAFNNPVHFADPKGKFIPCLAAGVLDTVFYYGMNGLTDEESTFGGAAQAFVEGALGTCFGGFPGKFAGPIAGQFAKVVGDSVFGDKPFNWKDARDELVSDIAGSLWPGNKEGGKVRQIVDYIMPKILSLLPDPAKACDHKLKQLKHILYKVGISLPLDKCSTDPITQVVRWVRSHDPNDIIGPAGYGAARFIRRDTTINIKIRFENDPNATASAQRVLVVYTFDKNIDTRTFKLGEFGFGSYKQELKDKSVFQATINLTQTYGVFVRVRGGLDIVNNKATWEFQTVELDTGLAPADPRKGFLPPNNVTSGQGFVTFSVKPKRDVKTLTRIFNKATIYFDENEPIDTPQIFNTIDETPPDINCSVVDEMLKLETLAVAISTNDIGVGYKSTDVLLKKENGYEMLLVDVETKIIQLPLSPGKTYELLFSPIDFIGNRHIIDDIISKNSIRVTFPTVKGSCNDNNNCSGNGNCTVNNICVCLKGFFGSDCSQDKPPLEPPIIVTRNAIGQEDSPIILYLSATPVNATKFDSLFLFITNYPKNSTFSSGKEIDSHRWKLNSTEFGNVTLLPAKDISGTFILNIVAELTLNSKNVSRSATISVVINPVLDGLNFRVAVGCFSIDTQYAPLQISAFQKDSDGSEIVSIFIDLPANYSVSSSNTIDDGRYKVNTAGSKNRYTIEGTNSTVFSPFYCTVSAIVSENDTSLSKVYNDTVLIRECRGQPVLTPPTISFVNATGEEDTQILMSVREYPGNDTTVLTDSLYIVFYGYPRNSRFSVGEALGNSWKLGEMDFGNFLYLPPKDYSGRFYLNITAYIASDNQTLSVSETMVVTVNPVIDGIDLQVNIGCYQTNFSEISMNLSAWFFDSDGSETAVFYIKLPTDLLIQIGFNVSSNTLQLNETEINSTLILHHSERIPQFKFPLNVTVVANVTEIGSEQHKLQTKEIPVEYCTETESFSQRITITLQFEVDIDLSNNKSKPYLTLFTQTLQALTYMYSTAPEIKDVFEKVVLFSIRKGSLIAEHAVFTTTNAAEKISLTLDHLKSSKRELHIGDKVAIVANAVLLDADQTKFTNPSWLSKEWTIVIACASAAFGLGFIVILSVILIRRNSKKKAKIEEEQEPIESDKLIEMSTVPFRIPRPKLITELKAYENYGQSSE